MPIKKGSISHHPARMSCVYRGAKLVWQSGEISTVTGISPLADETTEHVTPQSLHTTEGTTIIDVESNVDPV